jgi:hypothetical protein
MARSQERTKASSLLRLQQMLHVSRLHGDTTMGELVVELWAFLKERKKFWLLPIIMVLLAMGTLLVLTQGSVVAPFIYTLF